MRKVGQLQTKEGKALSPEGIQSIQVFVSGRLEVIISGDNVPPHPVCAHLSLLHPLKATLSRLLSNLR